MFTSGLPKVSDSRVPLGWPEDVINLRFLECWLLLFATAIPSGDREFEFEVDMGGWLPRSDSLLRRV